MKHPQFSTLQDYFENELSDVQSRLLKEHLLDCNECSLILSQMAKVDTKFKSQNLRTVSSFTRERIFSDARRVLEEKKTKIHNAQKKAKVLEDWTQDMKDLIATAINDLRAPAFQLASVSAVIAFVIIANQSEQISINKPLSEEVVVYTHGENVTVEGE